MINISLEAGKPGRHALLCGATLVFVTTLGQAVLIGAATTTVWVPLYAWVRANEVSARDYGRAHLSRYWLAFDL